MQATAAISGIIACWVFLGALFSVTAQAAETLINIRNTQTIKIGYREASLPFSYLDENKKPVGYTVDLCLRLAEAIRNELKLRQLNIAYIKVNSEDRFSALLDGKIDLECGSTTNNFARRKLVSFTVPHFIATVRMAVRSNSRLVNWAVLRGKRIVATRGSTAVQLVAERDKVRALGVVMLEGTDHAESFSQLENGEADAFAMDDVLLYGFRANAKNPNGFLIVGEPLSAEPYAIMMRKEDKQFKGVVDREMGRLIHDGELNRLYDKWFRRPIPPKKANLSMPMSYLLRDTLRFPTDRVADGLEE